MMGGIDVEEKIEEIKLSKDDSFIIRINYVTDGTTIGEYDSVQVSKLKNNIICKEHLSRTSAAVLKCAYDYSKGRHKGHYISHTPNAPLQWPLCTEVRPRNYKEIIVFLEDYACYFVYTKSKGVYWNPNPTLTHEPTVTPIETETIYKYQIPSQDIHQKAVYKIIILDDTNEFLEMLTQSLYSEIEKDDNCPYDIRIIPVTKSIDAITESQNNTIDIYIFDVVRGALLSSQVSEYDYFGFDLIRLLLKEKPNILTKSKFVIYSKLPFVIVRKEFENSQIEYYSKLSVSPEKLAGRIKKYLDELTKGNGKKI